MAPCSTTTKKSNKQRFSPRPGQCHPVDRGMVFWRNPPSSFDGVVEFSRLQDKDAILLLDFLPNQPFSFWKAVSLNTNEIIYTTTDNLILSREKD